MTGQLFYELLYDWAVSVVGSNVTVIQALQDISPPTTGTYLAIEDDAEWAPTGRASVVVGATSSDVLQDYVVSPKMWEVRGNGDLLRTLKESLELETTQARFTAAGVGILRQSAPILSIPYVTSETQIIREKMWQPIFTIRNKQTEALGSFATAPITTQWET